MSTIAMGWSTAAIGITTYGVMHLVLTHWLRPKERFRPLQALFVVTAPLVFAAAFFWHRWAPAAAGRPVTGSESGLWTALGVYFLLFLTTLTFYSALDHSVRLRIAVELLKREKTRASTQELLGFFDARSESLRRLGKLVFGGYLRQDGDAYGLTPRGKRIALASRFIRVMFRL